MKEIEILINVSEEGDYYLVQQGTFNIYANVESYAAYLMSLGYAVVTEWILNGITSDKIKQKLLDDISKYPKLFKIEMC